jgi:hypothetical protein
MDDEWEEFKKKYTHRLDSIKPSLKITIYGSYYPEEDLQLLEDLKKALINDGYSNTVLVRDRKATTDDPLEISQECMLFSDINLLVFTRTGKRYGVIDELSFITSDVRMMHKIEFSMVFDQKLNNRSSIPDLSSSRIHRYGVQVRTFRSVERLKSTIQVDVYWLMRKLARQRYGLQ